MSKIHKAALEPTIGVALERLCVSEAGMGASVQILLEASKQDLRISEVASTCKYETSGGSTSTENPVTHGVGVIMSLVRLIVEERPLTVLGIPGVFCLIAGVFLRSLATANLCRNTCDSN